MKALPCLAVCPVLTFGASFLTFFSSPFLSSSSTIILGSLERGSSSSFLGKSLLFPTLLAHPQPFPFLDPPLTPPLPPHLLTALSTEGNLIVLKVQNVNKFYSINCKQTILINFTYAYLSIELTALSKGTK